MPATPRVARQTLPKKRTAPRVLKEQWGLKSMWVAASNTAATIPATLLAHSRAYELICDLDCPWWCAKWYREGVLGVRAVFLRSREPREPHPGTTSGRHPVIDLDTRKVMINSQNHGFAVDDATLPENLRPTHRSLFDGSLQGVMRTDVPAFSFQGHPEASPGPHDMAPLFDKFIQLIEQHRTGS